jgi:hypothetical protein
MSFFSWLAAAIGNRRSAIGSALRKPKAGSRKPPRFRPRLEVLEGRDVPSTLTVTNNLDSYFFPPAGSLRAEIAAAQPGDTIVFDQSLKGKTITLDYRSELYIDKSIDIEGLGAKNLAISGGNRTRVFEIPATGSPGTAWGGHPVQVTLAGLTIENGIGWPENYSNGVLDPPDYYDHGGGILNRGTLTLNSCTVTGNSSVALGGGIANEQGGTMTITGCTISKNSSGDTPFLDPWAAWVKGGAGIFNNGTMTLSGSTVTQNSAYSGTGGILNVSSGSLTILSSTVRVNKGSFHADIVNYYGYLSIDSSTIGTVYSVP